MKCNMKNTSFITISLENSSNVERKVLTVNKRVDVESGKSSRKIVEEFEVGKTQIQSIAKRKVNVLEEYNNISGVIKWHRRKEGCSSVVRAFAHGAMGRQIDPSWWTH